MIFQHNKNSIEIVSVAVEQADGAALKFTKLNMGFVSFAYLHYLLYVYSELDWRNRSAAWRTYIILLIQWWLEILQQPSIIYHSDNISSRNMFQWGFVRYFPTFKYILNAAMMRHCENDKCMVTTPKFIHKIANGRNFGFH